MSDLVGNPMLQRLAIGEMTEIIEAKRQAQIKQYTDMKAQQIIADMKRGF